MSNPNPNTTPKKSNDDETNVINVDLLQRNNEDCKTSLELVLSCARNPEAKLGKIVHIREDENFAKNMRILEQLGYVRNSEKKCFELPKGQMKCPFKQTPPPRVQLKDNDKHYIAKLNWLENNDYSRNKDDDSFELSEEATAALENKASGERRLNLVKTTKSTVGVVGVILGVTSSLLFKAIVP